MNRKLIKTIVDVLLLVGLTVMGVTGIGMYLAPPGRIAKITGWTFLGLDKYTLGDIHTYFGFTMLSIGLLHLTLNWTPLKSLLKTLSNSKSDIITVAATISAIIAGVVVYLNVWE